VVAKVAVQRCPHVPPTTTTNTDTRAHRTYVTPRGDLTRQVRQCELDRVPQLVAEEPVTLYPENVQVYVSTCNRTLGSEVLRVDATCQGKN
jgi:hypothetical protein